MADQTTSLTAKCVDKAFDSRNAIQYYPNDVFQIIYEESQRTSTQDINLADRNQRKLVWLKTLGGRWVFTFDRANASNLAVRIFFCKECGQPFEKLNDIGNHSTQYHNKNKAAEEQAKADNEAEVEEKLLAGESIEDVPIVVEKRGKRKGKSFTCKAQGCGEVLPNLYAFRMHKKNHEKSNVPPPAEPTAEMTQQA